MKKSGQILNLDKNWWKEERLPTKENRIIIRKKRTSKSPSPLLTVKQVAERMNVSIWYVYKHIVSGDLDYKPIGKRKKRISEEALEEFLLLLDAKYKRS